MESLQTTTLRFGTDKSLSDITQFGLDIIGASFKLLITITAFWFSGVIHESPPSETLKWPLAWARMDAVPHCYAA